MSPQRPANPPTRGRLWRSFGYAIRGVAALLAEQANARIHLAASALVMAAAVFWCVERWEWCAIVLSIGLVWTAEALNTAIETLTDLVSPEFHPLAGKAKDIAAGAVLCSAIAAAVVGALLFGPRIFALVFQCG